MLPSTSRGGDPAAAERTTVCRSGRSLCSRPTAPRRRGDPKPASVVGAVNPGLNVPLKVGVEGPPTPAYGFEEAYALLTPPLRSPIWDQLARAQTGLGRTAASCVLPLMNLLAATEAEGWRGGGRARYDMDLFGHNMPPRLCILLLAFTREAAAQMKEDARFTHQTINSVVLVNGGTPMYNQLCGVVTGADPLFATPWYLLDIVESSTSCEDNKYLVLAVEKILDIGFEPMISNRVDGTGMLRKSVRRTMHFIATFRPEIQLPDLERSGGILVSTLESLMEIDGRLEAPLEAIDCLILDEADKMPDMNFEPHRKKMQQPIIAVFGETKPVADSLMHSMHTNFFHATAINGQLIKQKFIERSRTRLQPYARAYFFSLVLLLSFVGGSSTPVLENEFTMEFCPLNTSGTCPGPQFKRPFRAHSTELAEHMLQMHSERRMLANQESRCNDSQSLGVQIVSKAGSIISFIANFGPVFSMVGIEELDQSRKILLASSSMFISASNIFWAWYQQMQECPSLLITIILSLAAFLHALYSVLFWVHTDLNMTCLLSGFAVIIAAGLAVNLSVSTVSILALISLFTGHAARVAAIRRHRSAAIILAICGLCGFSAFYGGNWKDQTPFKISCIISSGSRIAELLVHLYFYCMAPEDAPVIVAVAPDDPVIQNASADAPGVAAID